MKSIALIIVACGAACGAACGGAAPPPQAIPRAVAPPTLQLELAGAEPQVVLRMDPALGGPQRVVTIDEYVQTSSILTGALPPKERTSELPRLRTVHRLEATSPTPGDTVVTATVEDIRPDGAVRGDHQDRLLRELHKIVGSTCSWHQAPSGLQDRFTGSIALSSGAVSCEAFRNSSVVFPDVPIGVGAIWKLSSTYLQGKVSLHRDATFQLVAFADDVATLDVSVLMVADPQSIDREPYASTDLESAVSSSRGIFKIPLHHLGMTGSYRGSNDLEYILTRLGKGLAGGESKARLALHAKFSGELALAP